ncbi:MAG: hypothetical protein KDI13_07510 [Alphaproteobacteria bacterium]|nr:hypothetical protein [Alphaproteobacteria bacterium]
MFGLMQKASSQVALAGAGACLDEVDFFLKENPSSRNWVLSSSYNLVGLRLLNEFGVDLSEDTISHIYHTYDFHRVSHDLKRRAICFAKNTEEWASSRVAMAAFSILGASPNSVGRSVQWARIFGLWETVLFEAKHKDAPIPYDENTIIQYDCRTGQFITAEAPKQPTINFHCDSEDYVFRSKISSILQNFLDCSQDDWDDPVEFLKDYVLVFGISGGMNFVARSHFTTGTSQFWVPMDCLKSIERLRKYNPKIHQFGPFVHPMFEAVSDEIALYVKVQAGA